MVELSRERIEQMLQEETAKKEELANILRGIYTRYMRLYEKYLADIDALNDDEIGKLRAFHEETRSLFRYYYIVQHPFDFFQCLNCSFTGYLEPESRG